ncbi:hypothetical protein RUND412_001162 [Rhizina undulata]
MASPSSSAIRSVSPDRPTLRGTRSFSRLEPSNTNPLTAIQAELSENPELSAASSVIDDDDDDDNGKPLVVLPAALEELPPELLALTDRFVESLSLRIHPAPLSVAQLSELFQQFYVTAFQAVETHISNLYLSVSSKKPRSSSSVSKNPTPMLSLSEISQKKKDRKLLEVKRLTLEEAIEKRITESVYQRIFRHKSTDDEARDESLRSKMAALKVVGVRLKHLGVELESKDRKQVDADLQPAVDALVGMNDKKYPLGKLMLLKQSHKAIVDCLAANNSSSSADYILPTLIYTLIISPPSPQFSIISNIFFVQRFRASKALDGEAAYCLTNLEAAISFLETVDLATLKVDDDEFDATLSAKAHFPPPLSGTDTPEGPWAPAGNPLSNLTEKLAHAHAAAAAATSISRAPSPAPVDAPKLIGNLPSASSSVTSLPILPMPPNAGSGGLTRKLSYLTPIDIATTAVSTADQGLRGIGSTLESSYKFLFGKMEKQGEGVPKTLEEARKLVETSTIATAAEDAHAGGSLKRVESDLNAESLKNETAPSPHPSPAPAPPSVPKSSTMPNPAAVAVDLLETVRNSGSSLGRFAGGIGAMRNFGRSATPTPTTPNALATSPAVTVERDHKLENAPVVDLLSTFPDLEKELQEKERDRRLRPGSRSTERAEVEMTKRTMNRPPIQRFLDAQNAGDLKISEAEELLRDYKRLAEELRIRGALD